MTRPGWQAPPPQPLSRKVYFALGALGTGAAWFILVQETEPPDPPPAEVIVATDVKTQWLEKEVPRKLSAKCEAYLDAVPIVALGTDRLSDQQGTVDKVMEDLQMNLYKQDPFATKDMQERYTSAMSTVDAIWLEMGDALYTVHLYDNAQDPCRQEEDE